MSRPTTSVLVRLPFPAGIDLERIRAVTSAASPIFRGVPGLIQKSFTVNAQANEAVNAYLWTSEEVARAFFSDQVRALITDAYGVSPTIEFAQVCGFIDNRTVERRSAEEVS